MWYTFRKEAIPLRTVKPKVLEDMIGQLQKYAVASSFCVNTWDTTDGQYLGGGQYQMFDDSRCEMHLGDRWQARYDCARFFRAKVVLPEAFRKGKVYFHLNFGGEILVRFNGKIVGAVSERDSSHWLARDMVPIPAQGYIPQSGEVEIELEACVNSGEFCNAAMDGAKSMEYQMRTAEFLLIDDVCEKYILDVDTVWDTLPQIVDPFVHDKVYAALDDSLHLVDYDFDDAAVRASIARASALLDEQLAAIRYLPPCEVVMDGHSHIDVAWLWRIQESERKAARTFSNNLLLMDLYPEFTFTQSQAILYDMVKRLYPDLYERLREKVKNGQWGVVGNTWVECDTNIASGEAMIRQLLYGREFFRKEFGVSSDTYWLPDCFGFSYALPQIIKRSGMKYFITAKLRNQDTNRFPHTLFRWRGADGSEILAYNQRSHYQGHFSAAQLCETAYNNDQRDAGEGKTFGMFGYGDGGGGCTYRMVETALRMRNFPGVPASHMGHPSEFFAAVEKDLDKLPVWNDEMYYENHRGTYTSQAFIKKNNRRGEFLLSRIEMASLFSGLGYDREGLETLWKLLLKNQFHDILPGTSIHEAIEDCRPDYARLNKEGTALLLKALEAQNAKISAGRAGVVVWNLTSFAATAPVTVEVGAPTAVEGCVGVCQTADGKTTLRFIAEDVPPMGYKFFPFGEAKDAPEVRADETTLENAYLRVTLTADGELADVYDKQNDRHVLTGTGNTLHVFIDKCVHETAWNLEKNYQKKCWDLTKADSVEVIEHSPVRGVVRVRRSFHKSVLTQDIVLYADARRVDFETTVDWHESDKVLKAAFPVSVLNTQASFEIAHGAIQRPTHRNNSYDAAKFEQCAHKWADLSEGDYGVSLLNDCKYGHDVEGSRMRITLLRAPTCPDRTGDHGLHTFTYSLFPHAGTWQTADTVQQALLLNVPLCAQAIAPQSGDQPTEKSFIRTDRDDIVIDAFKLPQEGEGMILRLYEAKQKRGDVTVHVDLPFTSVTECDLMETDETPIPAENGAFRFAIRPFEVKTFRLK